jgi:hypothetical protein
MRRLALAGFVLLVSVAARAHDKGQSIFTGDAPETKATLVKILAQAAASAGACWERDAVVAAFTGLDKDVPLVSVPRRVCIDSVVVQWSKWEQPSAAIKARIDGKQPVALTTRVFVRSFYGGKRYAMNAYIHEETREDELKRGTISTVEVTFEADESGQMDPATLKVRSYVGVSADASHPGGPTYEVPMTRR